MELLGDPKYSRGYAWIDGAVRRIDELFGASFKHEGYYQLTRYASRAFVNLYQDMLREGLLSKESLVVTEGYKDGPGKLTHPHESAAHKEGSAWDCRSESRNFTEDYIYKMFKLAVASGTYEMRFEPGDLRVAGMKERIISRLVEEYRVKQGLRFTWLIPQQSAQLDAYERHVSQYVNAHWGNATHTNAPHFHFEAKIPDRGTFADVYDGPDVPRESSYAGGGD